MRARNFCNEKELFGFKRFFNLLVFGLASHVALVLLASVPKPLADYPETEARLKC